MTDEIIIRFSVKDDGTPQIEKLNKKLGETREVNRSLVPALEGAKAGISSFMSANAALLAVLAAIALAIGKGIKDFMEYGDSVRQLSMISGESVENSSRFIQVLDDFEISAQDALQATRALTNNGLKPNITTLAALSDKYRSLTSAEEKNKFILDNLGRSGLQWVEILNKGSEAILQQGDAVADGLILTQEQLDQQLALKVAQDSLSDSWQAFTYEVLPPLIEGLTTVVDAFNFWIGVVEKTSEGMSFLDASKLTLQEMDLAKAARIASEEFQGQATSLEDIVDPAKAAADALQEISDKNKALLSLTEKLGDFQKNYEEDHLQAVEAVADAQERLNEAVAEYGATSDEALDASEELLGTQEALQELEASWHESTQRMMYDMIVTKLSVDGLTDAEFEAAIQIGVTYGVFSQATADMAREMNSTADAIVNGIHQTERLGQEMEEAARKAQKVAAGMAAYHASERDRGGSSGTPTRDSGGPGVAGQSYMIGVGAQPEMFIPNTNGMFIPNADRYLSNNNSGNNTTIIIHNPAKEAAETSVRKTLKNLSYLGVAA